MDGQKQPQAKALGADPVDIGKQKSPLVTAKLICSALSCRRKAAAATLLHIHSRWVVRGTQMKNSQFIFWKAQRLQVNSCIPKTTSWIRINNQSPTVSLLIQKTAVRFISAYTTGQMVQAHICLTSHHSKLKSRFLKQSQTWWRALPQSVERMRQWP